MSSTSTYQFISDNTNFLFQRDFLVNIDHVLEQLLWRFHFQHPGQLMDTVAPILQDALDYPINDEDMNFLDFLSGTCNFQRPPNGVYGINPPNTYSRLFHWRIFASTICQLDNDDRESFQFYSPDYPNDFGFHVFGQ
jgi:hypothetical protein